MFRIGVTYLSKYINEWRGRRAKSIPINTNPINLSDPVNKVVNRVWHQLREEAQAAIAKIKEEAHNKKVTMPISF